MNQQPFYSRISNISHLRARVCNFITGTKYFKIIIFSPVDRGLGTSGLDRSETWPPGDVVNCDSGKTVKIFSSEITHQNLNENTKTCHCVTCYKDSKDKFDPSKNMAASGRDQFLLSTYIRNLKRLLP